MLHKCGCSTVLHVAALLNSGISREHGDALSYKHHMMREREGIESLGFDFSVTAVRYTHASVHVVIVVAFPLGFQRRFRVHTFCIELSTSRLRKRARVENERVHAHCL